jgi:transcriptional regulator with XRE-family HTH domain
MTNERLVSALSARRLTSRAIAEQLEVDPKTVERWLKGRTPHRGHRQALAGLVDKPESYLWPNADPDREFRRSQAELVTLYPHRSDVPRELWQELSASATAQIDLLVYAALFLPEQFPGFVQMLREKAAAGCAVRVALGDPESDAVKERGAEERFGEGIQSRARLALQHYAPLVGTPGADVRLHGTTLYTSIYRYDEDMLVSSHLWGTSAYLAPVMHLRRIEGGTLFTTYTATLDAVWAQSIPVEIPPA